MDKHVEFVHPDEDNPNSNDEDKEDVDGYNPVDEEKLEGLAKDTKTDPSPVDQWETVCIDLIGLYPIGKIKKDKNGKFISDTLTTLHAMTMVDPATEWFEIIEVPNKRADYIANLFEQVWLARYPWPAKVIMDHGREFMGEVIDLLKNNSII
jgi:hypothetical protein